MVLQNKIHIGSYLVIRSIEKFFDTSSVNEALLQLEVLHMLKHSKLFPDIEKNWIIPLEHETENEFVLIPKGLGSFDSSYNPDEVLSTEPIDSIRMLNSKTSFIERHQKDIDRLGEIFGEVFVAYGIICFLHGEKNENSVD